MKHNETNLKQKRSADIEAMVLGAKQTANYPRQQTTQKRKIFLFCFYFILFAPQPANHPRNKKTR